MANVYHKCGNILYCTIFIIILSRIFQYYLGRRVKPHSLVCANEKQLRSITVSMVLNPLKKINTNRMEDIFHTVGVFFWGSCRVGRIRGVI